MWGHLTIPKRAPAELPGKKAPEKWCQGDYFIYFLFWGPADFQVRTVSQFKGGYDISVTVIGLTKTITGLL